MKLVLIACTLAALAAAFPEAGEKTRNLFDAIRKGDGAIVRALVESDAALVNARDGGLPAVRLAMYYRQPEIARYLIDHGAMLDFYDAAATGHVGRLRELLASDPTLVNAYSGDGATPLGLAAFFGHKDAVELLLEHGARINALANNPAFPFAPLHSAMSAGHKDIVLLLLARGADVNVREGGGMTPLDEAAGLGSAEYVNMLLERGADPAARSDDGKLPEDFARHGKHPDLADLLKRARRSRPSGGRTAVP